MNCFANGLDRVAAQSKGKCTCGTRPKAIPGVYIRAETSVEPRHVPLSSFSDGCVLARQLYHSRMKTLLSVLTVLQVITPNRSFR